jgi:hypothetical protein
MSAIARALHVSNNTVAAIREQEWQQVAARKERIANLAGAKARCDHHRSQTIPKRLASV